MTHAEELFLNPGTRGTQGYTERRVTRLWNETLDMIELLTYISKDSEVCLITGWRGREKGFRSVLWGGYRVS